MKLSSERVYIEYVCMSVSQTNYALCHFLNGPNLNKMKKVHAKHMF